MRFGTRLTLFFAATLMIIQTGTIWAIHQSLHDTLLQDGRTQVAGAEARFVRQLSGMEAQLAEGVRLLTLDFALRVAIADHDAATVVSALRNHGHRIGASRMLLIGPNGTIDGDTDGDTRDTRPVFAYPALLDRAIDEERAGTVAVIDGKPTWLVVVPVMAPDLIAFVAAALPLDDARLGEIRDLSGVPGQIGIVVRDGGVWRRLADARSTPPRFADLPDDQVWPGQSSATSGRTRSRIGDRHRAGRPSRRNRDQSRSGLFTVRCVAAVSARQSGPAVHFGVGSDRHPGGRDDHLPRRRPPDRDIGATDETNRRGRLHVPAATQPHR